MGKQRAGKTLSMVADGYYTLLKIKEKEYFLKRKKNLTPTDKKRLETYSNFELWSNLNLNRKIYGNYRHITPDEVLDLYKRRTIIRNKLILFDDIFKELDARLHGKEKNKILSYFTTEIGKSQNILYYVSHFTRRVELRLRSMTEFFIWCKKGRFIKLKFRNGKIMPNIWKEYEDYYQYEEDEAELKKMIIKQEYYKEYVDFTKDFLPKKKLERVEYLRAFDFFSHYDTGEIV